MIFFKGLLFLFFFFFFLTAGADIRVAFPAERQRLSAVTNTYMIGSVDSERTEALYVNGAAVSVYRTGAFLTMIPVKPGTNTVTLFRGRERLVRSFTVASPSEKPEETPAPILSDDDPRIGPVAAWQTTGSLFVNRVRAEPNEGDTVFYLPRGFLVRGAEVAGENSIAVWLEGRRGYVSKRFMSKVSFNPVPPATQIAPDPAIGFPNRPPYGKRPENVRICLDPGHGKDDSGALSPHGWFEKDVNLMQARAIRDALEKAGFQVIMTRDGDSFPLLMDRPKIAYDQHVDAFISIHHNATAANRDPRIARHTTTYASTEKGLALAAAIQKHVGQVLDPVTNMGPRRASYAVCRNPAVPSCLMEVDFINLPEGEEESWSPVRQKKVATAVVCGVLDWMTAPAEDHAEPAGETKTTPAK